MDAPGSALDWLEAFAVTFRLVQVAAGIADELWANDESPANYIKLLDNLGSLVG